MSKDHAEYLTDEQIAAEVAALGKNLDAEYAEQSRERDAYFTDPENAEEIAAMFARMEIVEAMYKARHEAGLTQQQIADKLGTNRTYIAALERGRKNITFATLAKYAAACGKKVALL